MSGSHLAGVRHARADLFSGAPYAIITVDENETRTGNLADATRLVEEVVRAIGAKPLYMTAEMHDREVARVSHTPQLLSIALANAVNRFADGSAPGLAGSGFRDMTRLAGSRWSVWKDVCETNRDEMAASLFEIEAEIARMRVALDEGRLSSLEEAFEEANTFSSRSDKKDEDSAVC